MLIRERITQAREARGLTVEELAEKVGVTPALVLAWEGGISTPRRSAFGHDELRALCRAVNLPLAFFSRPMPPPPKVLGPSSLDWHVPKADYLCDECDGPIDGPRVVVPGNGPGADDMDYHPWCMPSDVRRAKRDRP